MLWTLGVLTLLALPALAGKQGRLDATPPLGSEAALAAFAREAEGQRFQDTMNAVTKRKLRSVDVLYGSEDNLEGFKAFAEKRDPVWKGK